MPCSWKDGFCHVEICGPKGRGSGKSTEPTHQQQARQHNCKGHESKRATQDSTFKIYATLQVYYGVRYRYSMRYRKQFPVLKSFAITPCAEEGPTKLQLIWREVSKLPPKQIANLILLSAGFSFISFIPSTNVLQQLVLIRALAPCAQVQCPGISCETDKMYRSSGSYLSNTTLPNSWKGC